MDEDLVRQEAEKIHQRVVATQSVDALNEAWDLFHTFDKDEDEVVGTFESVLRKHVLHVSPLSLNSMVSLLRELNRNKLANELIHFYVDARSK